MRARLPGAAASAVLARVVAAPHAPSRALGARLVTALARSEARHHSAPAAPPRAWPRGSVVYYTGRAAEAWAPSRLRSGLGGAETAVLHLSCRWARHLAAEAEAAEEAVGEAAEAVEAGQAAPCMVVYLRLPPEYLDADPAAQGAAVDPAPGLAASPPPPQLPPPQLPPPPPVRAADAEERVTWRGARAVRWRGVLFVDVATFCAADTFDTLVVWRSAEVLEMPISARRVLLDLHDMPLRAELSAARLSRVDAVMVKSDFHRRAVIEAAPGVASRCMVLPNIEP